MCHILSVKYGHVEMFPKWLITYASNGNRIVLHARCYVFAKSYFALMVNESVLYNHVEECLGLLEWKLRRGWLL